MASISLGGISGNIRERLLIKPSKKNVQTFYRKVADTISGNKAVRQEDLIRLLNPMLRGWAQYHQPRGSQAGV